MLRAMWAILYAHYEGFFKYTWDCILSHLDSLNLDRSVLLDSLEVLSLDDNIKQGKKGLTNQEFLAFCKAFNETYNSPAKFSKKLETESNLYPNVIDENNSILNLELSSLNGIRHHLRALVSRRNAIAHGEVMVIQDINFYTTYENAVFTVMYDFALSCVDYIDNQKFLKR
ncbi:hypothetical protein AE1304_40910 [Aeromonas enteropelogenes]